MGRNAQRRKRKEGELHIDEAQMEKSKLMVFRMKDGCRLIISDRPFMDGMNFTKWDSQEGKKIIEKLNDVVELEFRQNIKEVEA
jgi:hypothetical protein